MKSHYPSRIRIAALIGAASACLLPAVAMAQDAPADEPAVDSEIVVTGTLIRGQAPTGSQLLSYSNETLAQIGATDTSELLRSIPQDNNFGSRPRTGTYGSAQTVNRPTLRYLGGTSSGGSSTLLLLDGHRMPGMGIFQTTPDIDAVAVGAIERIEIVTEGGSSTYGADAVGGVMNLITRKRFDGVEAKASYGFADDYWQWDASVTAGKTWENGSIWASYNYSKHDILYGYERDYVTKRIAGQLVDNNCNPQNVLQSGSYYTFNPAGGGSFTPGATRCDLGRVGAIFPSESRHSAFAGMNVDLSDNITFDVRAFYFNRKAMGDAGQQVASIVLKPTNGLGAPNPFYRVIPGAPANASQTVYFDLSEQVGPHTYSYTNSESWGVTPTITAKLGGDWRATAFFNYGEGRASFITGPSIDAVALGTAEFLGTFNPYNLNDPSNSGANNYGVNLLDNIRNRRNISNGKNTLTNARAVVDGPLFALPGGQLRVALGAEIMREEYTLQNGFAQIGNFASVPTNRASRTTKALFGEISLPVFGEDNRTAGFHALTLSASGRYDHYSDFGGTFNPKFGISWLPTEWWTIRASWGKSFQAPSLSDAQSANPPAFAVIPGFVLFGDPTVAAQPGQGQLILLGGGQNLKPQKATTWQIGTDIKPLPGLTASLSYYHINFKDRLSAPPFFDSRLYSQYPQFYQIYTRTGGIDPAYIAALQARSSNPTAIQSFLTTPSTLYSIIDATNTNLSSVETSGLDFSVNYQHPTDFGSLYGSVAGTYILKFKEQPVAGTPFIDNTNTNTRLRMVTTVGAKVGGLRGEVSWNHTGGFNVIPTASNLQQSRIKAFNTVNLFAQYEFGDEGWGKGLALTANVENLFNADPATYNGVYGQNNGYFGFTLGRLVQFGVRKRF